MRSDARDSHVEGMIVGWKWVKDRLRDTGLRVLVFALLSAPTIVSAADGQAADNPPSTPFIKTEGTRFTANGKPFYVTGVNNHYLTFGSQNEVTRVLDDAVAMGANVVRTFLQPVIGSLDGSMATIWQWQMKADASDLGVKGTYLIYWDDREGGMAFNDGANGMQKVDFLIAEASKRHLRLIIAFLDFWDYTGGAQQMRAWYGSQDKSGFFFRDRRTRRDYMSWVRHVVQRVNPITGTAYRDDPVIMAWELMNEGNASPDSLRLAWTAEMSAYVKFLDPNHLVSSGNAGNAAVADKLSDLTVATLDYGTWHGYPLYYNLTVQQFGDTVTEFCQIAVRANKPVLLEEFGYARSNADSASAYTMWLDKLERDPNCAGWLVWRLVSRQDSGRFPVDEHDQFDIRNDGGAIWNVFKAAAARAAQSRQTSRASDSGRAVQ
ncbi:cellulase family glycosylhydrolase [Bradyrhizobium sp. CER78]|uniref:glycoside hydrolase 5 family protein n=1 Tax=Bradyrhizobium sp. CER78 TaxID=3039162 RepID=UPI0024474C2C|nr:cellulase family glycosylhydrolase [Bradyrhizobium sp. CER78]MDH2379900.1 cellulase family glycosylhydrolase [Bradyrhizobium sp. CER78]